MIRMLLLVFGLVLGGAIGLLAEGRFAHLRAVAEGELPAWTKAVAPESRLARGWLAAGQLDAALSGLILHWRLAGLRPGGPVWQLRLDGSPGRLAGELSPAGWFDQIAITGLSGELVLDRLSAVPDGITGRLVIDRGQAELSMHDAMARTAMARLRWIEAGYDGYDLGEGRIDLEPRPGKRWRASVTLSGARTLTAEGTLRGQFGQSRASLELTVTPGPEMPGPWRNALGMLADQREGSYRLREGIALDQLLGGG